MKNLDFKMQERFHRREEEERTARLNREFEEFEKMQAAKSAAVYASMQDLCIKEPKIIAKITLLGTIKFVITDEAKEDFIKPTPEQIKNLKEMLCIDVELLEEEDG